MNPFDKDLFGNMSIPASMITTKHSSFPGARAQADYSAKSILEDMRNAKERIEALGPIPQPPIVEVSKYIGRRHVQFRKSKSKKKRHQKKARKDPRNWRYEWDEIGYSLPSVSFGWGMKTPPRLILSPPLYEKYLAVMEAMG